MEERAPDPQVESDLIKAARLGGRDAFEALVSPLRRELHLHCYRMTGSLTDADDMLQETLLKAWRSVERFEPRAPFRAWLYKIATNTCLTELAARRHPRFLAPEHWSGGPPPTAEITHLQPYPDRLISDFGDPAEHLARKENVAIAFIAAIQLLPPRQRAVLILCEVLGWSAKEVAEALEASPAGVNSALQRARTTLRDRLPDYRTHSARVASTDADRKLLSRFVDAWERADFDGLAALLQEDAVLAMPPTPLWFRGRAAIIDFLSTVPADGRLDRIRLVPVGSNRQSAVAAYIADPDQGGHQFYGLMVFAIEGDAISAITGFPDPNLSDYFALPSWLPDE